MGPTAEEEQRRREWEELNRRAHADSLKYNAEKLEHTAKLLRERAAKIMDPATKDWWSI